MTTISIRPIGQEAPVITGELVEEGKEYWRIRIAPNTGSYFFPKDNWELVPVPFVFPTAFGARITGVYAFGERRRLSYSGRGVWWDRRSNRWTENNITELLTDLRVVEADPDWGDE